MAYRNSKAESLIKQLLEDPINFYEQGKSYELLQEYFDGYSLETLRELLRNGEEMIKRVAIWIVSELGSDGCDLIKDVVTLTNIQDRYIKYHALESIMVCSQDKYAVEFINIIRSLHDNDAIIRVRTMRLVSNANESQLKAGIELLLSKEPYAEVHKSGISVLLKGMSVSKDTVVDMLDDHRPLIKKYGAIASKKLFNKYPELIKYAALSEDSDVATFSQDFISRNTRS